MTARREVIPRSYAVEDPEGLSDLVFRVLVRILLGHHREEGGKLEITRGIFVQCVHHVLQKGLYAYIPTRSFTSNPKSPGYVNDND